MRVTLGICLGLPSAFGNMEDMKHKLFVDRPLILLSKKPVTPFYLIPGVFIAYRVPNRTGAKSNTVKQSMWVQILFIKSLLTLKYK